MKNNVIKFNIAGIIQFIIIFLLYSTVIFNLQEYAKYFNLTAITDKVSIIYKIGKDLGIILIIFIAFINTIRTHKLPILFPLFYILFIYLIGLSILSDNIMLIMAGCRWILPIFLILALFPYIDYSFMLRITKVLYHLILIQVILQIIQMFIMPPIAGVNFLGLSARNTGFFMYPGPAGLFANVCFCFFAVFKKYKFSYILVFVSVIMAMSSTGAFIFFILLFFIKFYHSRFFKLLCLTLPIFAFFIFINLDTITGRNEGDTMTSGSMRVEILSESINNASLISTKFGTATNTAVSMNIKDSFIADSTYTSIITNMGFLVFFVILLMLSIAIYYAYINKRLDIILFLIVFGLGSITIITFEFFPVNILMPLIITYYIKQSLQHKSVQSI